MTVCSLSAHSDVQYGTGNVSEAASITAFSLSVIRLYTPWAVKTYHSILDYNSRITWWIFALIVPTKTGMNTLYRTVIKFTTLLSSIAVTLSAVVNDCG